MKSRETLSLSTSPQQAIELAKKLVGLWPHARPPDPATYAEGMSAVLTQYPLGLVRECVDPRTGLARDREFPPTVAVLVAWLDRRLAWHQAMAAYVPRIKKAMPELSDEQVRDGALALLGLKRAIESGMTDLTFEQAVELGSDDQQKEAAE